MTEWKSNEKTGQLKTVLAPLAFTLLVFSAVLFVLFLAFMIFVTLFFPLQLPWLLLAWHCIFFAAGLHCLIKLSHGIDYATMSASSKLLWVTVAGLLLPFLYFFGCTVSGLIDDVKLN